MSRAEEISLHFCHILKVIHLITLQFTVLLDTTTTPQHTDVSGALWELTSLSLVRTTASPALATPVQILMAPPTSHIAKVSHIYISDTEHVFGSEGSICQAGLQFLYFLVSKYLLPEGVVKVGKTMRGKKTWESTT